MDAQFTAWLRLTLAGAPLTYDAPQHRSGSEPTIVVFGNRPARNARVLVVELALVANHLSVPDDQPYDCFLYFFHGESADPCSRQAQLRVAWTAAVKLWRHKPAVELPCIRPEDKRVERQSSAVVREVGVTFRL